MDEFLLQHSPRPPQPVEPALVGARRNVELALAALASVRDDSLERPWSWQADAADVRYGFYRQVEALNDARAELRPHLLDAQHHEPPARPLVGAATAARWALHGLLATLHEDDLDRDPGNGEWTLRATLAHIVGGQRAYGWFTCWWLAQRDRRDDFPAQVPDELADLLPDEDGEGDGTLADVRRRLDDILDLSAGALGGLDAAALGARARWSGVPVTVGFRLSRWASHIAEHTVQLEKTLDMLDLRRSEIDWLVRLIGAAYGRLEEELYMWPPDGLGSAPLATLERATSQLAVDAASVQKASRARDPR